MFVKREEKVINCLFILINDISFYFLHPCNMIIQEVCYCLISNCYGI